jgi:hypothetical protein
LSEIETKPVSPLDSAARRDQHCWTWTQLTISLMKPDRTNSYS